MNVKQEIILSQTEKHLLKECMFCKLLSLSEYHLNIVPRKTWNLRQLLNLYFYWANYYNDDFIPEEKRDCDDKLSLYVIQEFKKFMSLPIPAKY